MKIKQDPVTGLWCREDGAVLMPPGGGFQFKKFRWTFGSPTVYGYRQVECRGKHHIVHRLICRAFHGLPPAGKPEVDHINRIKDDNRSCNLRWASPKENQDNKGCVDTSIEKYGVRHCDDRKGYYRAYDAARRAEKKAYNAAYNAKMKAKGLTKRKGPDGKFGWYPFKRS